MLTLIWMDCIESRPLLREALNSREREREENEKNRERSGLHMLPNSLLLSLSMYTHI